MQEDKIQAMCYQWFNNNYCLKIHDPRFTMFSVPNELGGRNKIRTMQMRSTGLTAGVSDTIIVTDKKVIFCEFKTATGTQSVKQREFESIITALGYDYWIVRSFEEFKNKIQNEIR